LLAQPTKSSDAQQNAHYQVGVFFALLPLAHGQQWRLGLFLCAALDQILQWRIKWKP